MNAIDIDYVSVVIAALIFLVIDEFWFSDIMFQKFYRKALQGERQSFQSYWKKRLAMVVIALVVSYFLALLESLVGVVSVLEGIFVGLGLFFGFVVPLIATDLIRQKKSYPMFFIESGYWFFSITILAGFLGV